MTNEMRLELEKSVGKNMNMFADEQAFFNYKANKFMNRISITQMRLEKRERDLEQLKEYERMRKQELKLK